MRRVILGGALIALAPAMGAVAIAYNTLTIAANVLGDVIALYERAGRGL